MSQKIIKLSADLANQIAAGEVVERPASVVKELVENALDAGATHVQIYLEESGISSIRIKDNGEGIDEADLPLVLEKYTTSKIASLEDLYHVMTFGFRGEALASIASVSEFSLASKTPEMLGGKKLENGKVSQTAMETGTDIIVKNLFQNTPARLNYLKTPRTEYLKILDVVQKFTLSHPNVAFELSNDGKKLLSFSLREGIELRLENILWKECAEHLLKIEHNFWWIQVSGYISDPKVSYQNRSKQYIFLNGRSIGSPIIAKAIFDAYKRFIAPKTQPAYCLYITLDPTEVDVNVHPRKIEVRFWNEQTLFRSVYHSVKDRLEAVSMVQSNIHISQTTQEDTLFRINDVWAQSPKYYTGSGNKFKNYSPYKNTTSNPAQNAIDFSKHILHTPLNNKKEEHAQSESLTQDLHDTPLGRIVWQVHNAYIIVETLEWLKILDQHALAERVIYEKISAQGYTPKTQGLLVGESFQLSNTEEESIEEYREHLENMWFEFELLPHATLSVYGIPDYIKKNNLQKVIKDILGDISVEGSKSLSDVRERLWAYTACRSAIKFWDPLSLFEMHALLHDASIEYSSTCPHGRPVVYDITLDELLGKYER